MEVSVTLLIISSFKGSQVHIVKFQINFDEKNSAVQFSAYSQKPSKTSNCQRQDKYTQLVHCAVILGNSINN
jgi:hypothetical protein